MANESQIVDLLVRAQFQGKADIENVSKAISKLSDSIEEQSKAAKEGEASIDELKAALEALKAAESSLKGSTTLLDRFKKLEIGIGKTKEKIEESTKAYAEYDAKLKASDKTTDAQAKKLARMATGLERLSTSLITQVTQQEEYAQAIQSMGLATNDLVASETRLVSLKMATAAAIGQAQSAMASYTEDMRAARKASAELAAAQRNLQLASDAKQAAQDYTALARESKKAVPSVVSLAEALQQVADPASEVRRTMAGTEAEISDLARSLTQIGQPAAQYREQMDKLAVAQRALLQQGSLIDSFRQQVVAVRQARQEFTLARAKLLEYAEGVKVGAVSAEQLAKAQKATADAAKGLNQQILVARSARDALEEVGVATDDLARAEGRIVVAAKEAAAALAQVGAQSAASGALQAVRQFTTLANASSDLAPKVTTLRDALRGIVDPAAEARRTVSGVEDQVRQLSTTLAKTNAPLSEYREEVAQLVQAQKSLQQQGSLIDTFRQQVVAVRQARQEFSQARVLVQEYAEGVKSGAVSVEQLAQAQNRLRGSATALQQQVTAARATRQALREAGVASNDLVAAENRIVTATRSATDAIQKYNTALKAGGGSAFKTDGRTTLSLLQRIRGEILALTASYVGLQGAINLAAQSAQKFNTVQGLENQLKISVGDDPLAVAAEMEYLRGVADRLGTSFYETAPAFAKFSASLRLAGTSAQETRYIYESFAEIGRVANLSADNMQGVLKAISDMASKGTIGAEELRQQLGDQLFGAMGIAAKALKDEFPDLTKAMEQGQVSFSQFIKIAEEYRKLVQKSLPAAVSSLAAEQQRFNDQFSLFQESIARAGWAESYLNLLESANSFLRSEDGAELAKNISTAFSFIADSLRVLIENFDEAALAFNVLLSLFAAFKLAGVISWLGQLRVALNATTVAMGLLGKAFLALGILFAAWQIATYLYDEFEDVRMVVDDLITFLDKAWAGMKISFQLAVDSFPKLAYNALAATINRFTAFGRETLRIMAKIARAAGEDGIAKTIEATIDKITFDYKDLDAEIKKASDEWEKELQRIGIDEAVRKLMLTDSSVAAKRSYSEPTARPTSSSTSGTKKGPTPADLEKQKRAYDALLRQIEALEARVDKVRDNTLAQQLAGFDKDMLKMERQLKALGDPTLAARYEQARADARQQVIINFNNSLLDDEAALRKKVEDLDAAAGRKQKTSIEERKSAVISSNAEMFRQIDEFQKKLEANGRDVTGALFLKNQAKAAQELQLAQTEMKAREDEIAAIIATREATLKRINAEYKAGGISFATANARTKKKIQEMQPEINKLTAAALKWAEAMGLVLTPEQLELFKAKMIEIKGSGDAMGKAWELTSDSAGKMAAAMIDSRMGEAVDQMGQFIVGAESFSDAVQGMRDVFRQFAADFLREIAVMIAKMAFFNALKNSGNSFLEAVGNYGAATMHTGGVVGHVQNRTRNVSPLLFANAPRYHSGGVVGMAPDEYPAILQKNEEVLAAGDPRNIVNGGGAGGASAQPQSTRFVLVDDRAKVAEAMRGAEGESVTLLHLRRNIPTLRQMLK